MNFSSLLFLCIRLSKYFFWLFLAIGVLIGSLIALYSFDVESIPNGSFKSVYLRDKTSVVFDQSDVAHIQAKYANDAYFALGYLHARERTWQMEFNRRLASGTLSEILGEKTIGIDRFMKTIGIRRAARTQYENLPSATKLVLEAYCNGINAGFADLGWALPVEFFLTRSKPALWTPIDSVSWSLMMALDLGDNWGREFSRLQLAKNLTTSQIWEILPPYIGESATTKLDFAKMYQEANIFIQPKAGQAQHDTTDDQLLTWLPQGSEGKGSNNWVIHGSRTLSKKPLLANDPHLGLSSPSTWYFAHLQANDLNVIGGTIPGLPGVVLGYTPNIAWGFTNTAPDVQDLYIEAINPKNTIQYKTATGFESFKVRRESILVKDKEQINFVVRETRHGPVISDAYPQAAKVIDTNRFVLALRWTALDPQNQSIRALIDMNKATTLDELKSSLENFYAPMQNVVMADTDGKIAFVAAGVAPKRMKEQEMVGVAPVFGWVANNEWKEYLNTQELPHNSALDIKPWIVTANQKVEDPASPFTLTGDWTMPYRTNRIQELLGKNKLHDLQGMQTIQNDTVSHAIQPLLTLFHESTSSHPLAKKAEAEIQQFQGDMQMNSAGALIFNAWVDQLTRVVFSDKLGDSFDHLYAQRGLRDGLLHVLKNNPEEWCRPNDLPKIKNCAELSNLAMDRGLSYLSKRYGKDLKKWQWGKAHPAVGIHKPLGQIPFLSQFFNISAPSAGDGQTINVGTMNFKNTKEPYSSSVAAGMRAVYDLSNLNQSTFIGFGGQSGWVQSPRYKEYTNLWGKGNYLLLTIDPKELKPYQLDLSPDQFQKKR
jgi:penicillin amidase